MVNSMNFISLSIKNTSKHFITCYRHQINFQSLEGQFI